MWVNRHSHLINGKRATICVMSVSYRQGRVSSLYFAPVAQWIEQRSSKPKVAGSNPVRGTIMFWE